MACIIKGNCMVRPIRPTWIGRLSLSVLDQTDTISHVPLIYFYKPPQKWLSQPSTISNILKHSLSQAIVPFFPLAGRLQPIGNGRFVLDCNAAGVPFIEAESQLTLAELGDFTPTASQYKYFIPTVNHSLPIHEQPVLLIQMTTFRCGGISIAVNASHVVVDGTSGGHFMCEWSRLSRGEPIETVPFHDRSIFFRAAEPLTAAAPISSFDPIECFNPPVILGQNDNSEERKKETTVAILKLTRRQVEMLKKMADESRDGPNCPGFTRFETLAGHVWRSACKARGHKEEQPALIAIPVDVRRRMQPPLPRGYFGNAAVVAVAKCFSGELASKPLGYSASRVRLAVKNVTDGYVRSMMEFLKNQEDLSEFQGPLGPEKEEGLFYGNPNMTVVSWLTLKLNGIDFGWGKEIFVGTGYDDVDGDSCIIPDGEGGGSVLVTVCLQAGHMDAFKKHFYEDNA